MRRYARALTAKLPTISVGGSLPDKNEEDNIKEETKKKVDEYRKEKPLKPESDAKPINMPLDVKSNPLSLDNEYIDIAKRLLRIPMERKPSLVEFAKAVISEIENKNAIIKQLSKPRNDGFNNVLSSNESNGSWN